MTDQSKNKILMLEQGQALLNYLGTKPYAEVYKLVEMIMSLPDQNPVKEENKPK
jgi:hypothetical protein